jgi:methyltransferase (TIGR00027 family)
MRDGRPSRTALGVAIRRAAHQTLDPPLVFTDPLAPRVLDDEDRVRLERSIQAGPHSPGSLLRAFVAARSRYAEDTLAAAVARGVAQYVVLGAGLDTFAYRNPHPADRLRVFEVDFPGTQAWKRARLDEAGIAIPGSLTFAPVDFETGTLAEGLAGAGFRGDRPAVFAWLGVVPYLTTEAIMGTLGYVAGLPAGTSIVFDYGVPPDSLGWRAQTAFKMLAARVEQAGEPFRTFFEPAALASDLRRLGFTAIEDLGPDEINARYFADRADGLRVGGIGRLACASRS